MPSMAQRLLVIALCIPVLAFLSLQLRSVRLEAEAVSLVEAGTPSRAEVDRAERLLDRASEHNPASEPEFRKAQLHSFTGEHERALALLAKVTADEPDHLQAWILTAREAEQAGDPELADRARARIAQLNPLSARPGQ